MANFENFKKLDIRVGRIIEIDEFPEAKNPSYKVKVDFGKEIGIKKSSVQLCTNYSKEDLKNKLVLGVVNFTPKQIGSFMSEVLILGVPGRNNHCILVVPERDVELGGKLY